MEITKQTLENERLRKIRIKKIKDDANIKINNELELIINETNDLIKSKKIKLTKIKNDEFNKIKSEFNKNDEYDNEEYNKKKEFIRTLKQIKDYILKQDNQDNQDKVVKVKKDKVVKDKVVKDKVVKVKKDKVVKVKKDKDNIISLINIIDELLTNDNIKLTKLKTNLLINVKSLSLDEIDNLELKKINNKLLTIQRYINKKYDI